MNSLSWFLYLADVLPRFGTGASVLGMVLTILGVILFTIGIIVPWNHNIRTSGTYEESVEHRKHIGKISTRMLAVAAITIALGIFIPKKETFYMIAASEIGEVVIKSEESREIFNELKDTIMSQLRNMKTERVAPPKTSNTSL